MANNPAPSGASHGQRKHHRFQSIYSSWMAQQEVDALELKAALSSPASCRDETLLRSLVAKSFQHYQEYTDARRENMREDALSFFCPAWCTSVENAFLWMAGCRPTLQIRLLYFLCGTLLESRLEEILGGVRRGDLGDLTAQQLTRANDLHCRTAREEDRISRRMALLQEDIADSPIVPVSMRIKEEEAREMGERGPADDDDAARTHRFAAMDEAVSPYLGSLAVIMEEAEGLRLSTAKELILDILTPLQAAELIVAGKQLHLSIHQWGTYRDKAASSTPVTDQQ